jgi:hypothetical protein
MRNLYDTIIESILTKTKDKVTVAKDTTLLMDDEYRRKMAGQVVDKLFHKVWDTLNSLDRDKLYLYLEKDGKPTKPHTDMFGREIHVGDLVVFSWNDDILWFGYVTGPSERKLPNEYDVMHTGYIYPERDNPFEESCSSYIKASSMAVICEYTDIEKTLKLLKKHCK